MLVEMRRYKGIEDLGTCWQGRLVENREGGGERGEGKVPGGGGLTRRTIYGAKEGRMGARHEGRGTIPVRGDRFLTVRSGKHGSPFEQWDGVCRVEWKGLGPSEGIIFWSQPILPDHFSVIIASFPVA